MNKMKKLALAALAGGVGAAQAAAVDVTAVKADITAQAEPVALIGGAVLLIVIGIKAFKWVHKALNGG